MASWRWLWPSAPVILVALAVTAWLGPILTPASPTLEAHVIGVYDAKTPAVEVRIDRPDAKVSLVLLSYKPLDWTLSLASGSWVDRVVLAGPGAKGSRVLEAGVPRAGVEHLALPLAWAPDGPDFHDLVMSAPRLLQSPLNSFQGAYTAPDAGFAVTMARDDNPALQPDYLKAEVVDPGTLPQAFQQILAGQPPQPQGLRFDKKGFHLTLAGGKVVHHPIPPDMPDARHTAGAARDPVTGKLYGASGAGEGFLALFDPATGDWSVASSLHDADPGGLIFDPEGKRLVIVASGSDMDERGWLLFYGRDGVKDKTPLALAGFPGLGDVLGTNAGANGLVPLAVAEGKILLEARSGMHQGLAVPGESQGVVRLYSVDMTTGQAQLAAWSETGHDWGNPAPPD